MVGRQPPVVVPPLHFVGVIPKIEFDCRSEQVDDGLEHLAVRDVMGTEAPGTLWRVLDIGAGLREIVLPGDVLVEWQGSLPMDIVRRDVSVCWSAEAPHYRSYPDIPMELVRHHQLRCTSKRIWSTHKDLWFTFCCDPYGRTSFVVNYVVGDMFRRGDVGHFSREKGSRFLDYVPKTLNDEIRWMRTKVIHRRFWDETGQQPSVTTETLKRAVAAAGMAESMMRTVRTAPRRGNTIRVKKRGSDRWWDRLGRELSTRRHPVLQEVHGLVDHEPRSWVTMESDEFQVLCQLLGWKEADPEDPPFQVDVSSKYARRQKKRVLVSHVDEDQEASRR